MRCYVLTVLLGLTSYFDAQVVLRVIPDSATVGEHTHISIHCSLNLVIPSKTDEVYSILIKKRSEAIAIIFQDGSYHMPDPRYTIANFVLSKTMASVLLTFDDVISCDIRGEYSCKMSVRRSSRKFDLGPEITPLRVNDLGKPYRLYTKVVPDKSVYNAGDTVQLSCYILQGNLNEGWIWQREDNGTLEPSQDSCHHSDADCMYKCRTTLTHTVAEEDGGVKLFCGVGEVAAAVILEVAYMTTIGDVQTTNDLHYVETEVSIANTTMAKPTDIKTDDQMYASLGKKTQVNSDLSVTVILVIVLSLAFILPLIFLVRRTCVGEDRKNRVYTKFMVAFSSCRCRKKTTEVRLFYKAGDDNEDNAELFSNIL